VQALQKSGMDYGYDFQILDSVIRVNEGQKTSIIPKMKKHFGDKLEGKKIALWGLAFKPDTDDIREAPALYVIDELLKEGAHITAFDPEAMPNVKKLVGDKISFAGDMYEATQDADALVIATEWSVFRNPDFERVVSAMRGRAIFDGRNLFELGEMEQRPFYYSSVGRRTIQP
jgi:UDPglucose 6-dehydrogenase